MTLTCSWCWDSPLKQYKSQEKHKKSEKEVRKTGDKKASVKWRDRLM